MQSSSTCRCFGRVEACDAREAPHVSDGIVVGAQMEKILQLSSMLKHERHVIIAELCCWSTVSC
jgi:hypothetical protein